MAIMQQGEVSAGIALLIIAPFVFVCYCAHGRETELETERTEGSSVFSRPSFLNSLRFFTRGWSSDSSASGNRLISSLEEGIAGRPTSTGSRSSGF